MSKFMDCKQTYVQTMVEMSLRSQKKINECVRADLDKQEENFQHRKLKRVKSSKLIYYASVLSRPIIHPASHHNSALCCFQGLILCVSSAWPANIKIKLQMATPQEQQIETIFHSFDKDKNGTIELSELREVAEALG